MGLFERQLWAGTKIDHISVENDYKTEIVPLDAAVVYFKHRGDKLFETSFPYLLSCLSVYQLEF